jgi:hypothetical protein
MDDGFSAPKASRAELGLGRHTPLARYFACQLGQSSHIVAWPAVVFNPPSGAVRHLERVISGMSGTIIPTTLPQNGRPKADPQPYSPEWLNALSDAQRQSPEIKEFSRRLHDSAAERVTWLFWHYQDRNLSTPLYALSHNGSMFFLDCGRGAFAVTAAHVYESYLEHVHKRRVRGVQVGAVGFDPRERLIASGKRLGLNIDIATFRVTPAEISATGKKIIRGTDGPWPPPPNKGDVVCRYGSLGVTRRRR